MKHAGSHRESELPERIRRAARGPEPRLPAADVARMRAFRNELSRSTTKVRNLDYVRGPDGKHLLIESEKLGSEIVRHVALPPAWGATLYRLVRELRPRFVVELGTGAGFSAAHIVAALRANGDGSLLTVEGAPGRAAVAHRQLSRFGADGWRIVVSLVEDFLPRLEREAESVDCAFIDADHLRASVARQVDSLAARMPDGGVVVLDDLQWPEVDRAWRDVCARVDCAWALEPLRWGRRRLGVWLKGPPVAGYEGRAERLTIAGITPPWAVAPLRWGRRRLNLTHYPGVVPPWRR